MRATKRVLMKPAAAIVSVFVAHDATTIPNRLDSKDADLGASQSTARSAGSSKGIRQVADTSAETSGK